MSGIHTFVTGISSPLPPLKMNGVLSCTCTVCCRRVIPSINDTFQAVLVRRHTRHSPRISWAPSIVSAPLTLSAARHSSNVSYLKPSPKGKSRRNRKTGSTAILIIVHSSTCRCLLYMSQKEVTTRKKIRKKIAQTFVLLRTLKLPSPTFSSNVVQHSDKKKHLET